MVYGITTLLRKKIDRSTQFGAVGYIITLHSSKSYVKRWGVRPNFGGPYLRPPVVVPIKTSGLFNVSSMPVFMLSDRFTLGQGQLPAQIYVLPPNVR